MPYGQQWIVIGHWCLWVAAITAAVAVLLGLQAYNSVNHDAAGHAAMQLHRNWAIPTATGIIIFAVWDALKVKASQAMSWMMIVLMFGLTSTVTATAWLGSEVVYRHGIGVSKSVDHSNAVDTGETKANIQDSTPMETESHGSKPHAH